MTEQNYAITIEFQSLAQGADATITLDTSGGSAWTIGETEIGINVSPTYGTASVALESFSITDSSVSVQANEAINLLNIQLSVLADPDANDGHPRIGGTLELPSGTSVVISSTASQSVLLGGSWCIDLPVTA